MEQARELTTSPIAGVAVPYSVERVASLGRRADAVVLQVDGTVSAIDGLAWLTGRRDAEMGHRLDALRREAADQGWSWAELTRARLKHLRPRRGEMNELGAAYLTALSPGAADAVRALRRAGISIALASDVAAEGLFGVAAALGVSPEELQAPRLRFDAIGAYVGCELGAARDDASDAAVGSHAPAAPRTVYVGTGGFEMRAPHGADTFIRFTGAVAQEGRLDGRATVASLADLAALMLR